MTEDLNEKIARLEHDRDVIMRALDKALDIIRELDSQLADVGLQLPKQLRERVRLALK